MVTTCDWRLLQPTLFRDLDCISDRIRDQRIKGDLLFGCGGITTEAFDQAIGKNAVSEIGIFMGELVHFARRQRCPPFSLDEKVLLDIRPTGAARTPMRPEWQASKKRIVKRA